MSRAPVEPVALELLRPRGRTAAPRNARRAFVVLSALAVAFAPLAFARPAPSATRRATSRPTTTRGPVRPERPADDVGSVAERTAALRAAYAKPPAEWPAPTLDDGIPLRELGHLSEPPESKDNPYSKAKSDLGNTLFFDPRLSGTGQMACVSCHVADLGWTDGKATSFGHAVQPLARNAPSLTNVAYETSFFWDGRAPTLEAQAKEPINNPDEMHSSIGDAATRLGAVPGYAPLFKAAFGDASITADRIAQALACFERTITTHNRSDFDRFLDGRDDALSDAAVRGLNLYRTTARCLNCHNGPEMTDHSFHNLGLSYYGRKLEDLGRYKVTKAPGDVGAFKTPSLRNVSRTAPYMHNGLFDLDGVINAYNAGMATLRPNEEQKNDPLFPTKDKLLKPLALNKQDRADLKAFLESLEEPRQRALPPKLP